MEHKANINLIIRMYQDHGYTVEDICLRLRYTKEIVQLIINNYKLTHGKSWRY